MKITAVIKYYHDEKEIDIPCGFGDKTFKWLAMTVCQRFSILSPHGILRCRDEIRAQTDNDQILPTELYLESGDVPHPSCLLSDFVKDGDIVYITLQNQAQVVASGHPKQSQWATFAFKKNSINLNGSEYIESDDEIENEQNTDETIVISQSNFMKILFESTLINSKLVLDRVKTLWHRTISNSLPTMPVQDQAQIINILVDNWDIINEIFIYFSDHCEMTINDYERFTRTLEIFSSPLESQRVFNQTIKIKNSTTLDIEGSRINFNIFCLSLILLSQAKFHDVFNCQTKSLNGPSSMKELMARHIVPFAASLGFNSYLKKVFSSMEYLYTLKPKSDSLFLLFQRYLAKSKDLPYVLKHEVMSEVLFDLKLQKDEDFESTKRLFDGIRFGTLNSRGDLKSYEFNFAEFVECIARASYFRYKSELSETNSSISVNDCFDMGINAAVNLLAKPESTNRKYYY